MRLPRIAYLWRNRTGRCTVCGKRTLFIFIEALETVRNHAVCLRCHSVARHRHLALCVMDAFSSRGIASLGDFSKHPGMTVFNTSTRSSIARALGKGGNIVCSEYFDDVEPGGSRDGVLCQDLHRLTFPDDSFDLVLSEDVFEHLPDYRKAFSEVLRVLKPGGYHIFTIPFFFDRKTRSLFDRVDGRAVLREPVEYHGDPIRGQIPCYTHFGYDLNDQLSEAGFEVRVEISDFEQGCRFGTFNCFTFVARKLPRPE
ncbi:MAG: methylase involved in ubiquinone/menaquinone biosynthesis [Fibrobacteres bacterium]|nr:methylase involved in ubiquinone/menaquinone biosynthesis [Fibrobacterota bacterium]